VNKAQGAAAFLRKTSMVSIGAGATKWVLAAARPKAVAILKGWVSTRLTTNQTVSPIRICPPLPKAIKNGTR
jgi:hypothetical protein